MTMTGRCLCGAVSYKAEGVKTEHHACHCGMCRKWGGGPAFAAVVESIEFEGEEQIGHYDSSDWAERCFCKNCGTSLYYRLKESGHIVVWVGTFDDQSPFRLVGEIYVDHKPGGFDFAGDHPRMTEREFLESLGMEPPPQE